MARRRLARHAVRLAIVAAVVVGPGTAADAHAFLVTGSPRRGERLAQSPGELRLRFTEPIVATAIRVSLEVASGH